VLSIIAVLVFGVAAAVKIGANDPGGPKKRQPESGTTTISIVGHPARP
jgi:hypothetical protein